MLTDRGVADGHIVLFVSFFGGAVTRVYHGGAFWVIGWGETLASLVYRPISLRTRWVLKENQRSVLAILVVPHRRNIVIARFLKVAMTRGAFPVRIWERSSRKVSSRNQCRPFSIPQCMRLTASRCWGEAFSGVELVIPYAISQDSLFLVR